VFILKIKKENDRDDPEYDGDDSQYRALTRGKLNEDKQNIAAMQVHITTTYSPHSVFPPLPNTK